MALHHKIRHHLHKFHKLRKQKEKNLPAWKEKWNNFNETRIGWLEKFVALAIPWMVIILFFIILGEFSQELNFFGWQWLEKVALFVEHHEFEISIIDKIVVSFFVIDLYFNFFKKATFLSFIKTSFIDIIAIAPLGLFFSAQVGEAQTILHVSTDLEKEAQVVIKEGEEAAKIMKLEKLSTRMTKAITRAPRLLRLNRLTEWFGKKEKKHHEIPKAQG